MPWWLIAVAAVALALTPFGESHLVQKWRMLFGGTLRRPLDWFDLVLHTAPLLLLLEGSSLLPQAIALECDRVRDCKSHRAVRSL